MRRWGVQCAPLREGAEPYRLEEVDGSLWCLYRVEPYYPNLNIYAALAEHVGLSDASEIYLPTAIARTVPLETIETLQKHVPRKLLQDKVALVKGSDFQFRLRMA